MNAFLNYVIEANIGLVLFMVAYALMLRNETAFKIKRMFLIIGILTSLMFPLLHIQYNGTSIPSLRQVIASDLLPELTITDDGQGIAPSSEKINEGWFYLQLFYVAGLAFFLIRFLIQFVDLFRTMKNAKVKIVGKLKIVESIEDKPTFSFFNFIFLSQTNSLTADEKQKIILHETIHAKQLHSLDILLLNIVSIFFWFNPLLRSYKKIFIQLHEFEADARAVENRDVNEYCSLLARVALQSADFRLANHFNSSLTLKRIEMMKTIKLKIKPWKMLVIAGVIPLAFFILACQDQVTSEITEIKESSAMALDIPQEVQRKYDELIKAHPDKKFLLMDVDESLKPKLKEMRVKLESLDQRQISHINLITPTVKHPEPVRTFAIVEYDEFIGEGRSKLEDDVFDLVDETAMPTGGNGEFYKYILANLRYPLEAKMKGIEGKVLVEFIVDTDGSIAVTGISGIGAGCELEAMRVVQASPKWIPGKNKGIAVKQRLTLPIVFALNASKNSGTSTPSEESMDEAVVVGNR